MSEIKFTKGEWYAHQNGVGCGGIAIVNTPNGCVIPKIEDSANQDLIAAAPEMYEMLIKISKAINSGLYEIELADVITEFGGDIENLLAKARGES